MQSYVIAQDEDRFDVDVVLTQMEMGDGTCVTEQDVIDEIRDVILPEQLDEIGKFVRETGFAASQAIGVALREQDAFIKQAMADRKIMMVSGNGKARKVVETWSHARNLLEKGWSSRLAPPLSGKVHRYQGVQHG